MAIAPGMGQLFRVDAQLGLGVGRQRVAGGQPFGDMPGQAGLQAFRHIDPGQLRHLCLRRLGELASLQREHRPLGVTLAAHRHMLP